jgi:hypothetical protein
MKTVLVLLGCVAAAVASVGQGIISVQLAMDQDSFVAGETIPVKVRVSNFAGRDLHLGKEADWLTFVIEDAQHDRVGQLEPVPVQGEFTLQSSMTGTKKSDLSPYYDLSRAGRYTVSAIVNAPELKQTVQSKGVTFDVINGSSIWDQEFGVPGTAPAGGAPEMRRYALIQTTHAKVIKLYLRLTDSGQSRIFAVFPLGTIVSFGRPELQLDKFSNLHVIFQSGAHRYAHCLVNPDGVLLARETYEVTSTRPKLFAEADGRVTVLGGERRPMPSDLPPPSPATPTPNATPDQK